MSAVRLFTKCQLISQDNSLEEVGLSSYLVILLLTLVHIDLSGFALAVLFHSVYPLRLIGRAIQNPLQMTYFL